MRDVVEILAIVAAGAWAFYTFVYENQIKPTLEKPEAQVESVLTKLGERNGLVAVRSRVTIANVGPSGRGTADNIDEYDVTLSLWH